MPEHHERARAALAGAGHVLDATPTAMIAQLDDVEAPGPGDPAPDPSPQLGDIGAINDLAYGTGDAFQRIIGRRRRGSPVQLRREAGRARRGLRGEPGPRRRLQHLVGGGGAGGAGPGLVSSLMRHALADGRAGAAR